MNSFLRPRQKKTAFTIGGMILLASLLLQACGQILSESGTDEPFPELPVTTLPQAANEAQEVEDQPSETEAVVLRVAMQPVVQIDPAFISSDPEVLVANSVYDYLVDVDSENKIIPRLAASWEKSEDGLTYVFTLQEAVTFHDGSPFTAADVVWTFNRLRDPGLGLPTADLYENVASIDATGDLEVTFTLTEPHPFFLYDLSDNHALILKAGTADAGTRFNGTGPFKVVEYAPEDRLVTEMNEAYFMEEQPFLDGVEFIFFPDQNAQVDALRGGQVDLVLLFSATDLYLSLQDQAGIETMSVSTNQFDLIRLRSDQEPGSDPRVMEAFKLATDREAIFSLVLQSLGEIGRDSPVGPIYQQYYTEDIAIPPRDVELAKELLAQAGYPEGLSLDLHVPDTGNRPNLAVVLKEQWSEAGINVNVIIEPESVYYGDNGWLEVPLGITGWGSRPYPQFYLETMLTCDAVWNESHFCDEEFDRLVEIAGTTLDERERIQAYHEIQRILVERGPVIVPYFAAQFAAIRTDYAGFELKPFPGRSSLSTVYLANP